MSRQNESGNDLNQLLDESLSGVGRGLIGGILYLVFVMPFKILFGIFRYKGSLIIWPIPVLLIIICGVTHQYSLMIAIIVLATIITYISKQVGKIVKWSQTRPKGGKSPLEKELDKIINRRSQGNMQLDHYTTLRAAAMHLYSPGDQYQLNDMRTRNVITEEEYARLRNNPIK